MADYCVYILSNVSRTLYIGVTNNLEVRIDAHRRRMDDGFTARYNINLLVYIESFADPGTAIEREKQLKRWSREKKIKLIERDNPDWLDLSADWPRGI